MNTCEIEVHNEQLLVIKSALPLWNDSGKAFSCTLKETTTIDHLQALMLEFIENPTEKKVITICDGMIIKIQLITEVKTIRYTLESIQDASKEMRFVEQLFAFTSEIINDQELTDYLDLVKEKYL